MMVVIVLSAMLAGAALPSLEGIRERSRMRGAVRDVATFLRTVRARAVAEDRNLGIVFERAGVSWTFTVCADGDGDGVRTADLASGVDVRVEEARRLSDAWPGVDFGLLSLPRVRKLPPSPGWMGPIADPIQFGGSNIVTFTPQGAASSGTLFLSDARGQMVAIVLFGPTSRVRIFRYDLPIEEWVAC